jgi:LytS/YehU family sensor histidine kinase
VGLDNTRRRLEQLYGDQQSLSLTRGDEGGLRVAIKIPWREAPMVPDA